MSAKDYAQQSPSLGIWQRISFLSIRSNTYDYASGLKLVACQADLASSGHVRWALLAACILTTGYLTPTVAFAQSPPPATSSNVPTNSIFAEKLLKDLIISISGSVRNDSNLFREAGGSKTSDTIHSTTVGLQMDKAISLQRFQLLANQSATQYAKTSRLNNTGLSYKAAWLWNVTPWISGTLSADRSKSPVEFEDTLGNRQRNVSIRETREFDVNAWVSGGWYLLAGVSQSDQTSEQVLVTQPDFRADSFNGGVQYRSRSGNSLSARRTSTDGKYQNLTSIATSPGYHEDRSELNASWTLSGKSTISGGLAWQQRQQDGAPSFNSATANLSYNWRPTGKLNVTFAAVRSTSPLQDRSFSYVVNDSLSVAPSWALSAKTSVTLSLSRKTLNYRGTGLVPPVGPARSETLDSANIGFTWAAMRSLSVGASLETQKRSSNIPGFDYSATISSINAALTF